MERGGGVPRRRSDAQPGRIDHLDDRMATYLTALRDAASAYYAPRSTIASHDPRRRQLRGQTITCALSGSPIPPGGSWTPSGPIPDRTDVVWIDHETVQGRRPPGRCSEVAPLSVSDLLLRKQVFESSLSRSRRRP